MKKLLNTILSIKNQNGHKVITILGLKIKLKLSNLILDKITEVNLKSDSLCRIQNNIMDLLDEPVILSNDFYPYLNKINIKDDYLNLIKGLDDESVLNVQKALARIQQLKNTNNRFYFLSNEELSELRNLQANFVKSIVQVDKEIWAYKDYLLPNSFFDSSVFYYEHNLKEFDNIDFSKSVIDAGASIGDSAVLFSRLTSDNVYSFEPVSKLYESLTKTIEINNLKNVIPVKLGLLDKETDKDIYVAGIAGQSTSINSYRNSGSNIEKVHFTTIDNFVKQHDIKVGLIKVDVEGAERYLLQGAINTIKSQKPALNISIYHNAEDFFKIKPLIESWNLGYKFKITKPSITNIFVETALLAEVPKSNIKIGVENEIK